MAQRLFKELLGFDEVEVCKDYTKKQIISKLAEAKQKSQAFKSDDNPTTVFTLAVVWIGFKLDIDQPNQLELLQQLAEDIEEGEDGTPYGHFYALTKSGEMINLVEYTVDIVEKASTQAILFMDF